MNCFGKLMAALHFKYEQHQLGDAGMALGTRERLDVLDRTSLEHWRFDGGGSHATFWRPTSERAALEIANTQEPSPNKT